LRNHDALIALLGERLNTPFGWRPGGDEQDCCSFAFDAAWVQTGLDVWAGERRRYSTARGAAMVIKRYGSIAAIADARFERVAAALARRGDIALVESGRGAGEMSLAIVEGGTLVAPGVSGLVRLPRATMLAGWDIERPIIGALSQFFEISAVHP
jgi:hypothetical protein